MNIRGYRCSKNMGKKIVVSLHFNWYQLTKHIRLNILMLFQISCGCIRLTLSFTSGNRRSFLEISMPVKLRKTLLALKWFFAKIIISSCTSKELRKLANRNLKMIIFPNLKPKMMTPMIYQTSKTYHPIRVKSEF